MPPADDPPGGEGSAGASGSGRRATRPADRPRWFGNLAQFDFDIEFYENILARSPDRIEVLRLLGELVSRKGLHARALELDRRLVALLPEEAAARYNLACSLALSGRDDEAIDCLVESVRLGYDDVAHMEVDPDLASLRGRPEFRALLGRA